MGKGKEVDKAETLWLLIGQASMFSEANLFLPLVAFDGKKQKSSVSHLKLPKAVIWKV